MSEKLENLRCYIRRKIGTKRLMSTKIFFTFNIKKIVSFVKPEYNRNFLFS